MISITSFKRTSRQLLTCAASLIALAACNRTQTADTTGGNTVAGGAPPPLAALPLTTGDTASAPAPAASALPSAPAARVTRLAQPDQSYAYVDRASAASDGYGDAPPDYAVDYNGERPWVWQADDGAQRVVEQLPDGLRSYYYEPGASEPYFVQDADYGYGYSDGELVAVYGPGGVLEPYGFNRQRAGVAGRYLAWAAALYGASLHRQHYPVEAAHWRERQGDIGRQRAQWSRDQSRQSGWAAYHQANGEREQAHWAQERSRRTDEVQRYALRPDTRAVGSAADRQGGDAQQARQQQADTRRAAEQQDRTQAQAQRQAAAQSRDAQAQSVRQQQMQQRAQAEQQRQATQRQNRTDASAHQAAEQAHTNQQQAAREQQTQQRQARTQADQQRQTTPQQNRDSAASQRQASEQAHAAQQQAAHEQQAQQRQARDQADQQRQAVLQQNREQAVAQRQASEQAHATQQQAAREQQVQQRQAQSQAQAEHRVQQEQVRTQQQAVHVQQQVRTNAEPQRPANAGPHPQR